MIFRKTSIAAAGRYEKSKVGRWLRLRPRMQDQRDHGSGIGPCSRFQRQAVIFTHNSHLTSISSIFTHLMSLISILPISPADLDTLVDLSRKVFFDSFNHLNTPDNMKEYMDRAFNPEQLLSELKNPMSEFYFITVEDTVAGYLKLNKDTAQSDIRDETSLEIERIYVDQTFQGKGLGAILMTKAVERAKDLNLQYIWLGVWEKNTDAKRFYERHGFVEFGNHEFKMGDDVQTDILMRRETVRAVRE